MAEVAYDAQGIAEAALHAQLLPNVLSKAEACVFGSAKGEYFAARDAFLRAWHRDPASYLSYKRCMADAAFARLSPDVAWRAYCFLCKHGHINAGLVAAQHAAKCKAVNKVDEQRARPVCSVPVRPPPGWPTRVEGRSRSLPANQRCSAGNRRQTPRGVRRFVVRRRPAVPVCRRRVASRPKCGPSTTAGSGGRERRGRGHRVERALLRCVRASVGRRWTPGVQQTVPGIGLARWRELGLTAAFPCTRDA